MISLVYYSGSGIKSYCITTWSWGDLLLQYVMQHRFRLLLQHRVCYRVLCHYCSVQLHCVLGVLHLYKVIGNGIIPGNKSVLHESLFDVFIDNKYLTGMLNITQSINQTIHKLWFILNIKIKSTTSIYNIFEFLTSVHSDITSFLLAKCFDRNPCQAKNY